MNKETAEILGINITSPESSSAFWGRACARAVKKNRKLQTELDKHRWIPVEERLPKARNKDTEWSENVQVCHAKNRYIDHDWYLTEQKRWKRRCGTPYTHWRYIILPEGD